MDQLGINIRKLRKSRGMTQEELADDSGTTKQSILKIEKGETIPLSTTLYCIASSLGTSVETLFGEDIEFLESSENIVLDILRNQYSFIELHRSIFTETKEDKLDKYGLENERKLLLSELDIDNMSNQDLYQLILIKQKNELENARKKYLKARVNHTMENNYTTKGTVPKVSKNGKQYSLDRNKYTEKGVYKKASGAKNVDEISWSLNKSGATILTKKN